MNTPWEHRFAQRTQRMASSAIRELLKLTEQPDVISFGGGMPAPEVFPAAQFLEASERVLKNQASLALQYGATEGYKPLREFIVHQSGRYGIKITPDNVLITSGSQQALDLIGKVFINRGDRILVEEPTYLGALQAWQAYGAEFVTVPMDDDGMIVDELEKALRSGPKFIYVLPNFQNPTGVTLCTERRKKLIEIADRHGVPIIEDDPYGQLRYEGEHLPPVVNLDAEYHDCDANYSGNVIYLGTFSKTLAPGLRLAWVVAPAQVIRKLAQAKQGADLNTSNFNQLIAYEVIKDGFLDEHVKLIRKVYRERRDIMLGALDTYFPPKAEWTRPEGGLFLWSTLPEGLETSKLLPIAIEQQRVAFVPGESFFACGGGKNTMRLNFSNAGPEKLLEGIRRLGRVISEHLPENGGKY